VHISSLRIDRFGVWTDLSLTGFSDGLNVIYGPNGSGKNTVVHFIQAMLYGFADDVRQRPLPANTLLTGGTITVENACSRQTIRREDDGALGRLTITNEDGLVLGKQRLQDWLAGVPRSFFERVFTVEFVGDLEVDRLIEQAMAHGFDFVDPHGDPQRLAELKEQLRNTRQALAELAVPDAPADELTRRRCSLQREIESRQASGHERRVTVERRLRRVDGDIAELEEQLDELQEQLHSLEAQIEIREAEKCRKEDAIREARLRQERLAAQRREALREIESQLQRWRVVLQDVEIRSRRLREEGGLMATRQPQGDAQPRHYLGQLETRVDALQETMLGLERDVDRDECQCGRVRSTFDAALAEIREDIYRLCSELSCWEADSQHIKTSSELSQLLRCETELRAAIASLSLQRQRLLAESPTARQGDGVVLHPVHAEWCKCKDHPTEMDDTLPAAEVPSRDSEALKLLEADLSQLLVRRQQLRDDVAAVEEELQELHERRRQLELQSDPELDQWLQAKRAELARVEQGLRQLERRRELLSAAKRLEGEIAALEAASQRPSVAREASELLRRLTHGQLHTITVSSDRSFSVADERGRRFTYMQLGSGRREQVYLSLCLALVAACSRRNIRLPLILNDAFVNMDAGDAQTAVSLLRDFCQRGHQVLMLTRHGHIADLFHSLGVPVRRLPPFGVQAPIHVTQGRPASQRSSLTEEQRLELNRQLNHLADETETSADVVDPPVWNSEEFPGELTDRVRPSKPTRLVTEPLSVDELRASDYFLLESSPIQDAPSIDSATAERFRKIGVLLVRDLLHLDVTEAAERLRYAGITAGMIRRWQSEALLACRVPRLRPYDARILVACGIADPQHLARLDAEELRRRVERFAETSTGQVLLRSGNRYELSRLTDWIRSARRSGYRRSAEHRSRRSQRRRPTRADGASRRHPRRERTAQPVRERTGSPPADASPGDRTANSAVVLKLEQDAGTWRFYLNTSDPIEEAPSIGPRTAERFAALGIETVADFLAADPDSTAARLKRRRISAATIRQWQQQAILACRIPLLRGHDAQILVACGITDPETLAKMDAGQLWTIVEPFVETTECKRIVRNGKAPDFEEVYHWIQWSRHARQLRAA
jgi:uncharacterized protein YhaN